MYYKGGFNPPLSCETIRDAYIWLSSKVQKITYFSTLLLVFKFSSLVQLRKWEKIEARFTGFTFKAADIKTINLIKRILSGLHNIAIQSFLTLHTTSSE